MHTDPILQLRQCYDQSSELYQDFSRQHPGATASSRRTATPASVVVIHYQGRLVSVADTPENRSFSCLCRQALSQPWSTMANLAEKRNPLVPAATGKLLKQACSQTDTPLRVDETRRISRAIISAPQTLYLIDKNCVLHASKQAMEQFQQNDIEPSRVEREFFSQKLGRLMANLETLQQQHIWDKAEQSQRLNSLHDTMLRQGYNDFALLFEQRVQRLFPGTLTARRDTQETVYPKPPLAKLTTRQAREQAQLAWDEWQKKQEQQRAQMEAEERAQAEARGQTEVTPAPPAKKKPRPCPGHSTRQSASPYQTGSRSTAKKSSTSRTTTTRAAKQPRQPKKKPQKR